MFVKPDKYPSTQTATNRYYNYLTAQAERTQMLGTDGFWRHSLASNCASKNRAKHLSTPSAVLFPRFWTINQRAKGTGLSSKALFKPSKVYARSGTMLLSREKNSCVRIQILPPTMYRQVSARNNVSCCQEYLPRSV